MRVKALTWVEMIGPGNSSVINQRLCEHEPGGYEFVNREQGLGEPGLRRAKETYRPHHFVEKHRLPL